MLDVYRPAAKPSAPGGQLPAGTPSPPPGGWPLIVAVPGGPLPPGSRGSLSSLAVPLAMQGSVIAVADYRSSAQYGGGYPETFADLACAIRRARELAPQYGANPDRVTLVSHSFGGWPATVVALTAERFRLGSSNCLAISGSPSPDAYVGIASIHTLDGINPAFLASFLGGTRDEVPDAWAAVDPLRIIESGAARSIPITVVTGGEDPVVTATETAPFIEALRVAGAVVLSSLETDADHTGVLSRPATLAAILGRAPVTTGFP